MEFLKKYCVWLALLMTIGASVWVSLNEENDMLESAATPKNRNPKFPVDKKSSIETIVSKENEIRLISHKESASYRWVENDAPRNIFSVLDSQLDRTDLAANNAKNSPANPFIYVGKIIEGKDLVIFLIDGEKSYAVKSGDVIEDTWLIKSIDTSIAVIKNIPLNFETRMEIGAGS